MIRKINGIELHQISWATKYYVSRCGKVYSMWRNRWLKQHNNGIGYLQVWLKDDRGVERWHKVHRLIASQFIPNPMNKSDVNHKDMNKANNSADNLEWLTRSENIQHSFDNGRQPPSGVDHWKSGKPMSEAAKQLMSAAKTGENHPKFKGWYITPLGRFASRNAAIAAHGLNRRSFGKLDCVVFEPK